MQLGSRQRWSWTIHMIIKAIEMLNVHAMAAELNQLALLTDA